MGFFSEQQILSQAEQGTAETVMQLQLLVTEQKRTNALLEQVLTALGSQPQSS